MAVGTTRPTPTTAWAAISDQTSVYVTHDGGPSVELGVGSSAPASTQAGSIFKYGDEPRQFYFAAGEELYLRQQANPEGDPAQITVMQSAHAG
jgi:hypothetical protein